MSFLQAVVAKTKKYPITRSLQDSMFSTVACSWWGLQAEPIMPLNCKVLMGHQIIDQPLLLQTKVVFLKKTLYIYIYVTFYDIILCYTVLCYIVFFTIIYIYIYILNYYIYNI